MNAHTHIVGGLVAAELLLMAGLGAHPVTLLVAGGFGGLLPDWDHPHSTLGHWIPWPAVSHSRGPSLPPEVGRRGWPHPIWHRHQAHSLLGLLLASLVCLGLTAGTFFGLVSVVARHFPALRPDMDSWRFLGWWIWGGLFVGGLSHLILDGFNESRQWWLWPFSRRGFRWPLHASVQQTDSWAFLLLVGFGVVLAWHLGHFPQIHTLQTRL